MTRPKQKDSFWFSKLQDANTCLRKYDLIHNQGIRPEGMKSGDIEFGSAIHLGIEMMFQGQDGLLVFNTYWDSIKDERIAWGRFGWEALKGMAEVFLTRFKRLHFKHIEPVLVEERQFGTIGPHKYEGTFDVYGQYKAKCSVIDFKTSSSPYKKQKIETAEQLVGYAHLLKQKGHPAPEQIVYIIFIKDYSKPRIQVLVKDLTSGRIREIVDNTEAQISDLKGRTVFPMNMGACLNYNRVCAYYEYCHGSKKVVKRKTKAPKQRRFRRKRSQGDSD